jgi:hypothetical protein
MNTENQENARQSDPPKKTRKRSGSRRKKTEQSNMHTTQTRQETPFLNDPITLNFAACGRCSYFWAGYRVISGEDGATTAFTETEDGWLELIWTQPMRTLLHKSYDVRLDADYLYYSGCCPDCTRQFEYLARQDEEEDGEETAVTFPTLSLEAIDFGDIDSIEGEKATFPQHEGLFRVQYKMPS